MGYHQDGDRVTIGVDWPERKRWWRNLLDAAPVEICLAGVHRAGTGQARGDEHTGVTVEIQLNGAASPTTATWTKRADGPERSGRAPARALLASDELAITIQDRSHAIAVVVGHRVLVRQRLQRL